MSLCVVVFFPSHKLSSFICILKFTLEKKNVVQLNTFLFNFFLIATPKIFIFK